jgi:toxin ParE1/3/4
VGGKYIVRLLPVAEEDVDEIVAHVALDNIKAASKLADRIESDLAMLSSLPELGRIPRDSDLREAGYRYLLVADYLVFYTIEKRTIIVHRILHGRRDYKELL